MTPAQRTAFKKILVVRNDKLGDFMLAYPSFAMLKENLPETTLYALVSTYTKDMAEACPWIDHVLIDPKPQGSWRSAFALARLFREEAFDALIALYSTSRVALAARIAGIPYRLAPATKAWQLFYSDRLTQRRSRSERPEYRYNQDLIRHFLEGHGHPIHKEPDPPFLRFNEAEVIALKKRFCHSHGIAPSRLLIFLHPGSGGSANNLSIDQYADLAKKIRSTQGHHLVISAGPQERTQAEALGKALGETPHSLYHSTEGLRRFAEHIQCADLFISGSTGPLHIAGALDVPTAAFYPRRRSSTALRWQTLNSTRNRLSFSPEEGGDPEDMQRIDMGQAAKIISKHYRLSPPQAL